ncbi:MAG TPA: hypothetical protein VGG30_02775, partial [Pirellulales bacterium]
MTELERLALLLGCKATLILGIVAALSLLVGRRGPQSCTTWLRFGIVALLALPAAALPLPMIGIPVLSAPRPAIVGGEKPDAREQANPLSAETAGSHDSSVNQPTESPAAALAQRPLHVWSAIEVFGLCFAVAYGLVAVVLAIRFFRAFRGLD